MIVGGSENEPLNLTQVKGHAKSLEPWGSWTDYSSVTVLHQLEVRGEMGVQATAKTLSRLLNLDKST